ncbi:MAG: glycosyltransferase family 39 protein [bacterium]
MENKYFLFFFTMIFLIFSTILYLNIDPINPHQDIDSKAYTERGLKFANTGSLLENDLTRPPYFVVGYSFFIGLIYKYLGQHHFYIILIQILLALLSGFLIFRICRRFLNETIARIAFVLFSFNLGYLVFSQFILTEILLAFLFLLFMDFFLIFFETKEGFYLISACLILGLSVLIKPAALFYIFFIWTLIFSFLKLPIHHRIVFILIAAFSFYLPIFAYMGFNKKNYGHFKLSALGEVNLYLWYYPNVLAEKNSTDSNFERQLLDFKIKGDRFTQDSWTEIKKDFYKDLKRQPFLFIYVWGKNVAKTLFGAYLTNMKILVSDIEGGTISYFKGQGTFLEKIHQYIAAGAKSNWIIFIGYLESIWSIFRFALALLGLFYLLLKRRYELVSIFSSFIFYFALISGHDGCARFRMMFEFVLIILAALGLYILFWFDSSILEQKNVLCDPQVTSKKVFFKNNFINKQFSRLFKK